MTWDDSNIRAGIAVRKLRSMRPEPEERLRIDFFLSQSYLSSYLTDLDAAMLIDLVSSANPVAWIKFRSFDHELCRRKG